MTNLVFFPDYSSGNPYQKLLYENNSFASNLPVLAGSLEIALAKLKEDDKCIFHQHWINAYFKDCETDAEAFYKVMALKYDLAKFKALGGYIIWTIHNEKNHESLFQNADIAIRRFLSICADIIHIHDPLHLAKLKSLNIDMRKIYICPHPSYIGYYGQFNLNQRLDQINDKKRLRNAAFLGAIRANKSPDDILSTASRLLSRNFNVTIAGMPENENIRNLINDKLKPQPGLKLILRRVSESEIHQICLRNNFGLLSYKEILTSGTVELYNSYGIIGINCTSQIDHVSELNSQILRLDEFDSLEILIDEMQRRATLNYMYSLEKRSICFLSKQLLKMLQA